VVDLSLDRIARAAETIDPLFRDTPQYVDPVLADALGREVVIKVETLNPLGSFKGRGADFLAARLDSRRRLVCATAGNFGQAIAYVARAHGFAGARVFVSEAVSRMKLDRLRALGAEVTVSGAGEHDAKEAAREYAGADSRNLFVEDGREAAIAEGAGTIAVELADTGPIDAVAVQVGDGALITGIARWLKEHSPDTRIIGVCASGAPAMALSWRTGRVVATEEAETIAHTLAIRSPVPESLDRVRELVDDFVLVDDDEMVAAARLVAGTVGLLLEPAGAAGIAAIRRHSIAGERVAAVLTGAEPRVGAPHGLA
jgi:threonine dehydratase